METFPLRLIPGQDLKASLDAIVRDNAWSAAVVLTGIGSLSTAALRFANQEATTHLAGPFEIVSLSGSLSADGSHLHVLVFDGSGVPRGGHLMVGSTVYTTAEIVLGILPEWEFGRQLDSTTGYRELVVRKRRQEGHARPDPE